MINAKTKCSLIFLTLLFAAPVPTSAKPRSLPATPNETEILASHLLEKLDETDKKSIAMVDLQPVFGKSGSFGPWLADELSSALARQDQRVGVIDRRQIRTLIETLRLSFDDESEAKSIVILGKALGATTVVVGSYQAAENGIGVTIVAFRTAERETHPSPSFVACMLFQKISVTSELTAHLDGSLESMQPTDGVYKSGHGGVSVPTCITCPAPGAKVPDVDIRGLIRAYPRGATVRLRFIVDTDGHTKSITALDPVGFGIDEQFVKAAKEWTFKPASDADGKTVPVRFVFQYSFNFK